MPARNAAKPDSLSLAHPFDCPTGDGGQCALPNPPMVVAGGRLNAVDQEGAAKMRSTAIAAQELTVVRGVEALAKLVDGDGEGNVVARAGGIVITCSCGHVVLASEPR